MGRLHLSQEEQRLLLRLDDVLAGATRMEELQEWAFPLLARLLSADIGAVCSWRADAGRYEWAGDLPEGWPAVYEELAPHDFVRQAVSRSPNVALVDAQIITPRAKKRSVLYQRTRDISLEHALSILLTPDGRPVVRSDQWHGGVTAYRTLPTPFSSHEAAILQQIASPFGRALQRCQRTDRFPPAGSIEAWVLHWGGLEAIVLGHDRREIARTGGATELLRRWFPTASRTGSLPAELVAQITSDRPFGQTRDFLVRSDGDLLLGWVCHRPPGLEGVGWIIVLEQRPRSPAAPARWRDKLSPREFQVAELLIQGMANADIATDFAVTEQTIKQHVQHIFDALGVNKRTQVCMRAYQEACRFPEARLPRDGGQSGESGDLPPSSSSGGGGVKK